MSKTITLKHGSHRLPKRVEYFYDGLYVATDGLLTLPVDREAEIHAAMLRGYNCLPDGTRVWDFNQLREIINNSK
jgi:hypothetical protein